MNTNLLDSIGLAGLDFSYIIIALIVLWIVTLVLAIIALIRYSKLEKNTCSSWAAGRQARSRRRF